MIKIPKIAPDMDNEKNRDDRHFPFFGTLLFVYSKKHLPLRPEIL
jgi:hypothetical protein